MILQSLWKGPLVVVDGEVIPHVVFAPTKPSWRQIARAVASKHDLTLDDITGPSRTANVVKARHEAMYRVRRETTHSLPKIGRLFGGRDHPTVMNALRRHKERQAA